MVTRSKLRLTSRSTRKLASLLILATAGVRLAYGQTYTISTFAGGGSTSGNNISATAAALNTPFAAAIGPDGSVYTADTLHGQVRKISHGVITTVADSFTTPGVSVAFPYGIAVDSAGIVYFSDYGYNRVYKLSSGVITTVAGNGTAAFGGDHGLAVNAALNEPWGIAVDAAGDLFIADYGNNRVREVSNGVITTVAGDRVARFSGDNGSAVAASLNQPAGLAVDSSGVLYIADSFNSRVRKVEGGVISTVAGPYLPVEACPAGAISCSGGNWQAVAVDAGAISTSQFWGSITMF